MKLNYAHSNVTTSEVLDRRRASIELNPTLSHVLSKDLYSNVVESPFREALCNALDATIEAGSDRPVEIHLPSMWNEVFYIRDFGIGMSPERFLDVYLSYGVSTRRHTNELTGGFGLGTKAILSYTSSFTVESYYEGIKRVYVVYHDHDNLPVVDLLSEEPSDEPRGIKVQYTTVSSSDWSQFVLAAENLLKRIPPEKYKLVGNTHINVEPITDFKQYGNTRLLKGKGNLNIIMGYVAYKMDIAAVLDFIRTKSIKLNVAGVEIAADTVLQQLTKSADIEIMSSIGEYPVHPSRERINVTPRAVNMLCKELQLLLNALFAEEDIDLVSDMHKFRLTSLVPGDRGDLKIRARFIIPTTYYSDPIIPPTVRTYRDLVHQVVHSGKQFQVSFLSTNDFTDYLGNGRNRYSTPSNVPYGFGLLFIDIDSGAIDKDVFSSFTQFDATDDIAKYRREQEARSNTTWAPSTWPPRTTVKSMQEPQHNILVLKKVGNGKRKADWDSAKHNVASLKELKGDIFWVPTRMGCITDHIELVEEYARLRPSLPKWKKVVIIGLPATKGTLTIERAFKPLAELRTWIDAVLASDYMQRRAVIRALADNVPYTTDKMAAIEGYGKAHWLIRLINLSHKINSYKMNVDLTKVKNGHKAAEYSRDIDTKFGYLNYSYYNPSGQEKADLEIWAKELANLLNCHPTGARSRNS